MTSEPRIIWGDFNAKIEYERMYKPNIKSERLQEELAIMTIEPCFFASRNMIISSTFCPHINTFYK